MKLLQKGRTPKPWKGTCQTCGAKYEEAESALNVISDRDGSFAEKTCIDGKCRGRVFFYPPRKSNSGSSFGPRSVDC